MFTLDDLLKATKGEIISRGKEVFSGASIDTRTIGDDEIFFPLKGSYRDGHEFLKEALKKSSGAVVSKEVDIDFQGKTVIKVQDTLKSLQALARHLRNNFKGKVIAVIGSNGKTTTKELIASFLSTKYKVLKTEGNLNNNIGVPICLSRVESDTEILVFELGTNRLGDIRELCEILFPEYVLITNIGYEHIEGFGSIEGVRTGELEILPYVKTVFANGDDNFLMDGLREWKGNIFTFGTGKECDFTAQNIVFENEHIEFDINSDYGNLHLKTKLTGIHNVYNITGAVSVAVYFGIKEKDIKQVLENFSPVKMRGEIININGLEIFFDAYNANPSSMKAALQELARRKKRRTAVAVLGDMLELGEFTEKAHEDIGKWIKELGISFIGVGKFIKNALKYTNGHVFDKPEDAGEFLNKTLKGTEVILIKGSRAMKMEQVLNVLKERKK